MESVTQITLYLGVWQLQVLGGQKKCDLCDKSRKSLIKILLNKSHSSQKSVMLV